MRYISRITKDNREQLSRKHLEESSDYARRLGAKLNVPLMAYLITLFHDMGKFAIEFIQYLRMSHVIKCAGNRKTHIDSVVHSTQGARYLYELQNNSKDLVGAITKEIIAMCIANHHGGLMDGISPDGETPFRDRMEKKDGSYHYTEVVKAFFECGILADDPQTVMDQCAEEMRQFVKNCENYRLNPSFMVHLLTKYLFSCLVDADRYNAYCFEAGLSMEFAPVPLWDDYILRLENRMHAFPMHTAIDRLRHDVSELCLSAADRPADVYLLNVSTGSGKTLSSLRFALNHAKGRGLDHIIYVIPYLSVLEQTVDGIKEALNYNDKEDDFLLEHHSNWNVPDDEKEAQAYRLLTDRWDSPIIITTTVQFLESVYSDRSGDLRKLHNMANSVFIFDEIQSLPIKCTHLFNETINFLHYMANCTVLLCTATQPLLNKADRPIYLSESTALIPDMSGLFLDLKRTRVEDCTIRGGYSPEALARFVLEKYLEEGNCLIILNTRKDAAALLHAMESLMEEQGEKGVKIVHLSTFKCSKHRLDEINAMKCAGLEHTICISTQLIEAGVDISFRCVIRAIAGLDSIAQAAGRCNRGGEEGKTKTVYLVNIAGEDLSLLPDIKYGADITYRILAEKREELLSPDVMERYYKEYFSKQKVRMDYPLKSQGNLYDLLSSNQKGTYAYLNKGNKVLPALRQAFQSAGKEFSVIEQQTIPIFVPYGEGIELLKKYKEAGIKEKNKLLRQLGRYSVSVYSWQLKKLEEVDALQLEEEQLWILNAEFYSGKLGVVYEREGI